MASKTKLKRAADQPALILYWPGADGGLWDPEVSALVEQLEEDLEVFVTCTGSGRGALELSDAAAAARFMGCSSLVVVSLEGDPPTWKELENAFVGFGLPAATTGSEWTVSAVAKAYHEALSHARQAA